MGNPIFDHKNHVKLWNWLAENPHRNKEDWPEWTDNGGKVNLIKSRCFACEYAEKATYGDGHPCNNCPLNWNPTNAYGNNVCDGNGGLYIKWRNYNGNDGMRTRLALAIANANVKENVICDSYKAPVPEVKRPISRVVYCPALRKDLAVNDCVGCQHQGGVSADYVRCRYPDEE